MSLLVVFVANDAAVINLIAARRETLIPNDVRERGFAAMGGEEIILSAYQVNNGSTLEQLFDHIDARISNATTGVMILADQSLPGIVNYLGDIFIVNTFQPPAFGKNLPNALVSVLTRSLRCYKYLKTRFNDSKYHQILRLPLRNFLSPEIYRLRTLCHDMISNQNFGRSLDESLGKLRDLRRPKQLSSHPVHYLVDDDNKHFQLGHEFHARADTSCPPHNVRCVYGNMFRFGRRFDGTRHFNVSHDRGAVMAGNYPDCHDNLRPGLDASHLNMFSNDFF